MKWLKQLLQFLKDVANDSRIPERDKAILLALIVLIVSPLDLIPDWIPVLGQLDDLLVLSLILDYFFRVLDGEILLSHWPWGMKSFVWLRRFALTISWLAPNFLKKKMWSYIGRPY